MKILQLKEDIKNTPDDMEVKNITIIDNVAYICGTIDGKQSLYANGIKGF